MKQTLLLLVVCASLSLEAQMAFTPNLGQYADQDGKPASNVLFKATGTGPGIFITTSGITYVFTQKRECRVMKVDEATTTCVDWSAIHMNLVGADVRKENIVMEDELAGVSNFYYAHCPQGITGVKSYHKVTIKEIYPGIDWVITADDVNGMAHDFYVHENGNHKNIVMQYDGLTAPITLNDKQQLTLTSAYGTVYEGGLKVIRAIDNDFSRQLLRSYFSIDGNKVSYLIYRRGRCGDMIIDPPLQWSSLQASTGYDYGAAVAATKDGSGDVLGCGYTDGTDFPMMNAYQGTLSAQEDAVIYRLDGNGARLWSTYFGGSDIDNCKGIATDLAGNAYVTGHTSSQDLPVMNSLQANYGGGVYDAFIAKYNSTGVMQWASWRGGTGTDFGTAITSDDAGTIYVVGYTNTTVNFPLLNPIQSSNAGIYDGFVMSLNSSQVMQWSTFYGGTDEDKFRAVALDANASNIYITGNAVSGNFPTAGGPFQNSSGSAWFFSDAIIMKMTINQSVVFATYLGGNDEDIAYGVTADPAGNVYVTGYTLSTNFPVEDPGGSCYVDSSLNQIGACDMFIAKCNSTGTSLMWATYFGGASTDFGFAMAYDVNYGIYVCGNTASTDFPVMQPADLNYYQPNHGDGGNFNDMFITWFDINDSLRWSTYYGNSMSNEAYGLSIGMQDDIYVTGVDSNEIAMLKFNPGLPTNAIVVCNVENPDVELFPNPASNELNVAFYSAIEGTVSFEIVDNTGRLIRKQEFTASMGDNKYAIDVASLSSGTYFLKVKGSTEETTLRFVKN